MGVKETIIENDMILVVYDFRDTPEGNAQRNKLRNELTSSPFYAKMMNQSVYYLSATIQSLDAVRRWAKNSNADIKVFGNVDATIRDRQNMAKEYYIHMQDIVREVNDNAYNRFQELKEFEDNMDDEGVTIRGWHKKIEGVTNRFADIRKLISRVGDDKDEFELEKLATFIKTLCKRYDRVKSDWEAMKK